MPKNKGKNQKNQKTVPAKAQPTISIGKQEEVSGSSTASLKQAASDIVCTGELACQPLSKDIKFINFSLSYFGENLIQDTSLELNFGRRYGLIGRNGSGKTTFLRALAARVLQVPSHIDIYLLEEEVEATEMTPTEAVIDFAQKELQRLEALENQILEEEGGDSPLLEDIYERMDLLEPRTFEKRAGELLFGLGFGKEMISKKTKDLSGGWRMRVAIARALFIKPTLLLLDEPTNHLDLETCVWFEQYLKNYDRILVLVSHSQDFLNGVCTNTIHLTPKKTLMYYGGNYSTFCRTLAENERNQMKQYEKQQEEIKHIKDFIASCGTYANLVRQAKSRQKILDKMVDDGLIEKVEEVSVRKLTFPDCDKLSPPVLAFQDVSFSYDGDMKKCLYTGLEFGIDLDSRIVLVGPNGAGKSTLLKLMDGSLIPTSGFIQRHSHLRIAKYNQHSNEVLDGELNPIDYMRKEFPEMNLDVSEWRQRLGKNGISGKAQTKKISTMSDGQKSQLVFCWLSQKSPHMLLFDEPTNHLDMESIDALAEAINEFQGGMVLVSHDFRLLQQTAKEIWVCDKKKVTRWDGDIASYKAELMRKMSESSPQ